MNRFVPVAAAAAALFAMSAAQAATILVDDFNAPVAPITVIVDTTAGNGAVGTTPASFNLAAPNIASTRELSVDLTSSKSGNASITGSVGGSAGFLNFSVSTGDNGIGRVKWTLPTFSLPASGNNYFFSVIASALGAGAGGSVPNNVEFSFNGTVILSSTVGAAVFALPGTPVNFALTADQSKTISSGGILELKVSGGEGWNLILDQFAISSGVPEPTSLALVGLALLGAGVASRRRKA
jgi:hypothetical protein